MAKSLKKSLLKTEGLASLYRLEGALDATGITESNLLLLGVKAVSTESKQCLGMMTVNSKTFTIQATVTCPIAFLDWGTVEIVTC